MNNDTTRFGPTATSAQVDHAHVVGGLALSRDPFGSMIDNIVRAAQEAIVTVDETQRIVMINPAAQRMFGVTGSEALGKSLSIFIPMRFRGAHAKHVRDFDQSGTSERRMGERSRVIGIRANGQEFEIEATISRLDVVDGFGPRPFFTALMRDLTEVNDLRSELEGLNKRMQMIFELAPIAIWITESERIVFANRACGPLFGIDNHLDLMGRSIYSLLAPESQDQIRRVIASALGTDRPVSAAGERLIRLDGKVREVDIAIAALPDHGQTTVQMVITDVTTRTSESRELELSRHQLRQLSASLVDAREEERRRIARELHDELGQRLTALHMELSNLHLQGKQNALTDRIAALLGMVNETVASVRRIATELRPLMLDDLGLIPAIEWLASGWAKRMDVALELDLGERDPSVGEVTSIALYRMVQEALTNVARHAKASRVKIQMRQESDALVLTVQDNGVGFSLPTVQREGSHGLMGIRERAFMLGGHLEIGNSPMGGGQLRVRVPLSGRFQDQSETPATPAVQARNTEN